MNKILLTLIFLCWFVFAGYAQLSPKEGSSLHYRIIGFELPARQEVTQYKLEIANGIYNEIASFKKNIISSLVSSGNTMTAEVPKFGAKYTWRVIYSGKKASETSSELYHFSIRTSPNVDTTLSRFRIQKTAGKFKDAFVFLDGNKALYDMNGKPVWFLPDIDDVANEHCEPRDMKITPQGTISFLAGAQPLEQVYEISYDGALLWKGPNTGIVGGNDSVEHYHHEFTRMSNGHYMAMGDEFANIYIDRFPSGDSTLIVGVEHMVKGGAAELIAEKVPFATIIEYDEKGNVVWSYRSSQYFTGSDLIFHRREDGSVNFKVHDNAFYFNEKEKAVYISYKDISRIIKVSYPAGNALNTYGEVYRKGAQEKGNVMFCGQHCCRATDKGLLYMLNNNECHNGSVLPKIVMMQQKGTGYNTLNKIWEYQCTIDDVNEEDQKNMSLTSGGNVAELSDHSIFCSMGSSYSKVFIVDLDKEILWSAIPEQWNNERRKWEFHTQYRASIIENRKQLDGLILSRQAN